MAPSLAGHVIQLFSIPTLVCSWHVQQGMASLMLCLYTLTNLISMSLPKYTKPLGVKIF